MPGPAASIWYEVLCSVNTQLTFTRTSEGVLDQSLLYRRFPLACEGMERWTYKSRNLNSDLEFGTDLEQIT